MYPSFKEPRFLVAQHNFSHQPAILYWYDIKTMLEIAHPNYDEPDDDSNNNVHSQQTTTVVLRKKPEIQLPYATKVAEEEPEDDDDSSTRWPISPTAEKVGEFKVSPSVHVGYAMTWYGLSMAGLYMTRLLLFKR
jgi:cytochrome oxidase assembly protein ShyY1